jgi:hypothetical protein
MEEIELLSTRIRAEQPAVDVATREINAIRSQINQLRKQSGGNQVTWNS